MYNVELLLCCGLYDLLNLFDNLLDSLLNLLGSRSSSIDTSDNAVSLSYSIEECT